MGPGSEGNRAGQHAHGGPPEIVHQGPVGFYVFFGRKFAPFGDNGNQVSWWDGGVLAESSTYATSHQVTQGGVQWVAVGNVLAEDIRNVMCARWWTAVFGEGDATMCFGGDGFQHGGGAGLAGAHCCEQQGAVGNVLDFGGQLGGIVMCVLQECLQLEVVLFVRGGGRGLMMMALGG